MSLYQQVAEKIAEQIRGQLYQYGDKIPGTRILATIHGVSINTVLEAQKLLVDWGYVRAAERSGYFVRWQEHKVPSIVKPIQKFKPSPKLVKNQALLLKIQKESVADKVINLATALPTPGYFPLEVLRKCAAKALRDSSREFAQYSRPHGLPVLREQLAKHMLSMNCPADAQDIIVSAGCQEALNIALRAVTSPGDIVALESPTYFGLLQILDSLGLQVLEIPSSLEQGFDLNALEQACHNWPIKCIVTNGNFNNPLGYCVSDEHKKQLIDIADKHNIPIIEDDIFGDLGYSGYRPAPLKSFDTTGNVIYCNSFSKTLTPGPRVGWLLPGRFYDKVEHLKFTQSIATSTLDQKTIATFLHDKLYERHLRKMRRRLAERGSRFRNLILEHFPETTIVSNPQGGIVLWVICPKALDTNALYDDVRQYNISFMPGNLFTISGRYRHCLRINCAVPDSEEFEEAVKAIGKRAKKLLD